MRMKAVVLSAVALGAASGGAVAQYDGARDCESFANAFYKKHDSSFKRFIIDRNTVEEIAFDDNVGSQHVTAIFRGRAKYMDTERTVTGTFICLHGGPRNSALFIHLIPNDRAETD